MIKFRYHCFHMCSNLFCRPILICHMFYTKINQFLFTGILEFAICVAPLTIFFIEITIWLFTNCGIIKWHSTALAYQLPGFT